MALKVVGSNPISHPRKRKKHRTVLATAKSVQVSGIPVASASPPPDRPWKQPSGAFYRQNPTPKRPGISASPPGAAGIEHRSTRKQSRRTISPRGVAQLVARDVWDVDAAGSNPVTPTKNQPKMRFSAPLSADFMLIIGFYPPLLENPLTAEMRLVP